MAKIYDALLHASRERQGPEGEVNLPVPGSLAHYSISPDMEEEMLSLFQSLEAILFRSRSKVIQFIGSREGEGTSTIAREFARVSAFKIGRSVLLLDADRFHPSVQLYFPVEAEARSWIEAIRDSEHIDRALFQVENSRLFVSPSSNSSVFTPEIFEAQSAQRFWDLLRQRFDLVIIDSAPLAKSPDGLAIAPNVDGVILVMEAERTRSSAAENVKERITKVGGNVLGVVFNKRRFHIPRLIYRLLFGNGGS